MGLFAKALTVCLLVYPRRDTDYYRVPHRDRMPDSFSHNVRDEETLLPVASEVVVFHLFDLPNRP